MDQPIRGKRCSWRVGTPRRKPIDRMALLSEPIAYRSLVVDSLPSLYFLTTKKIHLSV